MFNSEGILSPSCLCIRKATVYTKIQIWYSPRFRLKSAQECLREEEPGWWYYAAVHVSVGHPSGRLHIPKAASFECAAWPPAAAYSPSSLLHLQTVASGNAHLHANINTSAANAFKLSLHSQQTCQRMLSYCKFCSINTQGKENIFVLILWKSVKCLSQRVLLPIMCTKHIYQKKKESSENRLLS